MTYLVLLGAIILLSSIVVKTGSIALRLTGLDEDTASFQALSAFTNTGFTTREAERIVGNPLRRRIIRILIILGNAGAVSIIVTMIRTFSEGTTQHTLLQLGVLVVFLYLLYRFAIARRIKKIVDRFIEKRLAVLPSLRLAEFQEILSLGGEYGISYIEMTTGNPVAGKSLKEALLSRMNILVLAVERDGESLPTPSADTVIHPGDRLIAYGKTSSMREVAQGEYYPPGTQKPAAPPEPPETGGQDG